MFQHIRYFARIIALAEISSIYSTRISRVDPYDSQPGWVVQTVTGNGEPDVLLTRTLINLTGLSGPFILEPHESSADSSAYVPREGTSRI